MQIRIMGKLKSRLGAGLWKHDRAAVREVRIQFIPVSVN
jgi:hypothetical protein